MTSSRNSPRLPWRRSAGFLAAMLVPIVTGLVTIPLLIGHLGPTLWSHLVVAQMIGSLGYLGVARGWFAHGPTRVASLDPVARAAAYRASVRDRAPGLGIFGIPVVLVCLWAFETPAAPVLIALAQLIAGLGGHWFFVGSRRPGLLLLCDTMPRVVGVVIGVSLLTVGAGAAVYAASVLLGSCIAAVLPLVVAGRGSFAKSGPTSRDLAFLTTVCFYATTSAPLLAVAWLASGDQPAYAMADRLLAIGLAVLAAYTQAMQGWVPEHSAAIYSRTVRGLWWAVALAVVAFLVATLGMPVVASVLSSGSIGVPSSIAASLGVVAMLVTLSQYLGLVVLAGVGGWRWVATSAVAGVVVGIPVTCVLAAAHGGLGAALGCVVAESIVLLVQVAAVKIERGNQQVGVRWAARW